MLAQKLSELNNKHQPHILVIGDLMLDHYILGNATRLSPEAPVPVVNVKSENKIIGGAGNVANNIIALGGKVSIAGVIGTDVFGDDIRQMLAEKGAQIDGIVTETDRSTTIKTRVLAGSHQIVRIDREVSHSISNHTATILFEGIKSQIESADIIILSDYNKGVLTKELCQKVISFAALHQKKVLVDPKGIDYTKYQNAFVIKPNKKELIETSRVEKLHNQEQLKLAADRIFEQTQADHLVVTLSEEGMALISKSHISILPVQATEVFDVTGAGDTVIATMAFALALGLSLEEACKVANFAAAIVIRHVGSACTSVSEILSIMQE